ncbi:AIF_collapsed_G0031800.mRNA.1.CDS.1 [Saccharomyces cerevisiae]|nr:AIF_collapsed_G0031800.mRNA.1.CDS.1 [Saccharomyces cerevisiae]
MAIYGGIKEELQFSKSALAKYKDSINDPKVIGALEKSCEFCSFELSSQVFKRPNSKIWQYQCKKAFFGSPCFQPNLPN